MTDAAERLAENPFFVLGLAPDTSAREVEREAQKLLGMLELGLGDAGTYATPLGPRPRSAEAVRAAAAVLRDPRRRLVAELWAAAGPLAPPSSAAASAREPEAAVAGWDGALNHAGWGPR